MGSVVYLLLSIVDLNLSAAQLSGGEQFAVIMGGDVRVRLRPDVVHLPRVSGR